MILLNYIMYIYIYYRYFIFNERPFASLWSWESQSAKRALLFVVHWRCQHVELEELQNHINFGGCLSQPVLQRSWRKFYFPFYQGYTLAFGFLAGRRLLRGKWSRQSIGIHFSRFSGTATTLGVLLPDSKSLVYQTSGFWTSKSGMWKVQHMCI